VYLVFHNRRNDEVSIAPGYVEQVEPIQIGGATLTKITLRDGDEAVVKEDAAAVQTEVADALREAA